jgi:hypothetical protein
VACPHCHHCRGTPPEWRTNKNKHIFDYFEIIEGDSIIYTVRWPCFATRSQNLFKYERFCFLHACVPADCACGILHLRDVYVFLFQGASICIPLEFV